jgi:hypothetical protein
VEVDRLLHLLDFHLKLLKNLVKIFIINNFQLNLHPLLRTRNTTGCVVVCKRFMTSSYFMVDTSLSLTEIISSPTFKLPSLIRKKKLFT